MTEHDPELSQAYRQATHPEPPPALDARILAAARQVVAPQPRRRSVWFGWAVPVSSLAVLVLGVSMLFRMQQDAPDTLREAQSPVPQSPVPAKTLEQAELTAPNREKAPQAVSAHKPALPAASVTPAPTKRYAEPADAAREMAANSASARLPAASAAPQPTHVRAAAQENRAESLSAAPAFSAGISRMQSAAPAAAKAAPPEETPEQWVETIRQLLRQGDIDAARTRLEALRKRHPDFPLPPDLEPAHCCPASVPTP